MGVPPLTQEASCLPKLVLRRKPVGVKHFFGVFSSESPRNLRECLGVIVPANIWIAPGAFSRKLRCALKNDPPFSIGANIYVTLIVPPDISDNTVGLSWWSQLSPSGGAKLFHSSPAMSRFFFPLPPSGTCYRDALQMFTSRDCCGRRPRAARISAFEALARAQLHYCTVISYNAQDTRFEDGEANRTCISSDPRSPDRKTKRYRRQRPT